jgi:IMP dehydrogenase
MKSAPLALTFADVSLVPRRSRLASRSLVSTKARFSRNIELSIPIVSANMDTVTTAPMAIAMAQMGGLGVLHRFNTIEGQVADIVKVKRHLSHFVDDPYSVSPDTDLETAIELTFTRGVSSLLVIDNDNKLVGILTSRDIRRLVNENKVRQLMTPLEKLTFAPQGVSQEEARRIMLDRGVEKLPILEKDGRVAGLVTLRDINAGAQWPNATRDEKGRLMVAAAIGVRGDYLKRAEALIECGCDALVLDIAHGHADHALEVTREIKALYPSVDMVVGNSVTPESVQDFYDAGADAVKIGIGGGAACTTRTVAGTGVPQWSAINWCSDIAHELDIPLIADGGIREPGDVVKAIGAGASTVMAGSIFAGRDESPGELINRNGRLYKRYRGMASSAAAQTRLALEGRSHEIEQYVAEGAEMEIEMKGPVSKIVQSLVGGLRSGMSYVDAANIEEFWEKAEFVQITMAGRAESEPISGDR